MAKPQKTASNLTTRPGSKVWQMQMIYMGVKVRKSTGTTDLVQAQECVEKEKREIYNRLMNPPTPTFATISIKEGIEKVYKEVWYLDCPEYADNSYKMAYAAADIVGRDLDLTQLDVGMLLTIRTALRSREYRGKRLSETTVNRYMTAFRTMYNHAAEQYKLPWLKFSIPKKGIEKNRVKVYTREEADIIRQWFLDVNLPDMADLCVVLEYTGFRLSEALNIGKFNKENKLISEYHPEMKKVSSWENKGDLPRTIPLLTQALTILELRGKVPFPLLKKDAAQHYWDRMRKTLEISQDNVMHVFRHTCASNLLKAGASLKEVQEWLGHANIKTTEIYAHLAPDALDQVAKKMVQKVALPVYETVYSGGINGVENMLFDPSTIPDYSDGVFVRY